MNTTPYLVAATILSLGLSGCASTNATHETLPMTSPSTQSIELPRSAGSGNGKEVSVLLDERHLKLATIALRDGTPLPPHTAPVPVTIQVLEGEGVIHTGGKPVTVTRGSLVSLVANEEHEVVPKPGGDMLLLVHYLRGAK